MPRKRRQVRVRSSPSARTVLHTLHPHPNSGRPQAAPVPRKVASKSHSTQRPYLPINSASSKIWSSIALSSVSFVTPGGRFILASSAYSLKK